MRKMIEPIFRIIREVNTAVPGDNLSSLNLNKSMKNTCKPFCLIPRCFVFKYLIIMKLTVFLMLGFSLQSIAINGFAQKRISLNVKSASIENVLKTIESKSDYRFVYGEELADTKNLVDVYARNAKIDYVMEKLLQGTSLSYKKMNNNLVVIVGEDTLSEVALPITGKLVDEKGDPLAGVSVTEKGTTNGVTTNGEGVFTINVKNENAVLVVSMVGYQQKEVLIKDGNYAVIQLLPSNQSMEDVVVIGYGTSAKRDLTTAVTSIKPKDFVQGAVSPLLSLQGKVPGLSIVATNGADPNSGISLQLRGVNSLNASQGPLIVIDGIPGGDIEAVVKEDIASIDVLKDASAGAIYGTRASGGVILITTKKPQTRGQVSTTFTSELFIQAVRKRPEVLSASEYLAHKRGDDLGHVTDWYNEVTNKDPFSHRHVLNVNGGGENANVSATFNIRDAKGMAIASARKEIGGRINTNFKMLNGFLELTNNISYECIKRDFSDGGMFNMALLLNPTDTPFNPNDVTGYNIPVGGWDYFNPVAEAMLRTDINQTKSLLANMRLKAKFTKNLSSSVMFGIDNKFEYGRFYRSSQHRMSRADKIDGYASQSYGQSLGRVLEWTVNYKNTFADKHSVDAVVGYTYQDFNGEGFNANNSNFPVEGLRENSMGSGTFLKEGRAGIDSYKNPKTTLVAFLARASYSYLDRYLLTASLRKEGSSKFSKGNQWGLFPGLSVGWRVSEESFLKNSKIISDLKIRGGYGETGNEGFDPVTAFRMYSPDAWWLHKGSWIKTFGVAHNQNAKIKWEIKQETNLGFDIELFGNRLSASFDVYRRKVKDLLYSVPVSQPPAIYDRTTINVGSLENRGFEGTLTGVVITNKNFNYTTTFTFSHNKSYLSSLYGAGAFIDKKWFPSPGSPGDAVRLSPGEGIGRFFLWRWAGFTPDGKWMLYDKTGKAFDVSKQSKTVDDKAFIGNAIPQLILSWNNAFQYKRFDASVYMRSWLGYDVFNMINMYYGIATVKNINVLRASYGKYKDITGEKELSDYWLEKGNFLKIDALNIGYTFPTSVIKPFKGLRLYATGRDLFVFTKYSGLDPEVNINGLEPGFEELDVYPKTRTFMLGLQLNF